MNRNVILTLLVLLVGCVSSGVVITKNNNQIDMPHYSILAVPDTGWGLTVEDKSHSTIYLKKSAGSAEYQMRIGINWLSSESTKSWTAKQVADDYRNGELSDMQARGVMTSMMELENVVMGEEIVGNKKFYIMNYDIIRDGVRQNSSLYLYFPKEINIGVFIVAIYIESSTGKESLYKSNKPEFIRVLESLQVKQNTAISHE